MRDELGMAIYLGYNNPDKEIDGVYHKPNNYYDCIHVDSGLDVKKVWISIDEED